MLRYHAWRPTLPLLRPLGLVSKGVGEFARDTRGAATALTAAALTVMSLAGIALVSDHLWLVDQRDTLKRASNAASIAATLEMNRLSADLTDEQVIARLEPLVRTYVRANLTHLPPDRLSRAMDTLVVEIRPDRQQRTVEVRAQADLDGTLFARHMPLLGNYEGPVSMQVASLTERAPSPIEVVLAIDVSQSMDSCLDASACFNQPTRMAIVQDAARTLVDVLDPSQENKIAIGVVPWHTLVQLDPYTRGAWEVQHWAQYPRSRHYGASYFCTGAETSCTPDEVVDTLPFVAPEPWLGCLDEHRMSLVDPSAGLPSLASLLAPPAALPFAQAFYPASYGIAYACRPDPLPGDFRLQLCYGANTGPNRFVQAPQYRCGDDDPTILPLTSDRTRIEQAISALSPIGPRTYSSLGVLWASPSPFALLAPGVGRRCAPRRPLPSSGTRARPSCFSPTARTPTAGSGTPRAPRRSGSLARLHVRRQSRSVTRSSWSPRWLPSTFPVSSARGFVRARASRTIRA